MPVPVRETIFQEFAGSRDRLVLALDSVGEKALTGSLGEIPRVEAFFARASTDIGAAVTHLLPPGWKCRISASFVHGGRPDGRDRRYIVDPVDPGHKPCEIGDLLVAVEHVIPGGSTRSALLIQAKRAAARADKPWGSEKRQRELFNDMPTFVWREKQVYFKPAPPERTLRPELFVRCPCGTRDWPLWGDSHWSRWPRTGDVRYAGAVFATLLDSPLVVPPIEGVKPRPLAAVLADMLLLTGGWEFKQPDHAFRSSTVPLGWSAVVWELLLRAAVNEHRRSGTHGVNAIYDPDRDQVRFTGEDQLTWPEDDDGDPGGISVLRVLVDGREALSPE